MSLECSLATPVEGNTPTQVCLVGVFGMNFLVPRLFWSSALEHSFHQMLPQCHATSASALNKNGSQRSSGYFVRGKKNTILVLLLSGHEH